MTTPPANPASYAKRFQAPEDVSAYETKEYGAGSFSSRVWQWQRPVVAQIIRDFIQRDNRRDVDDARVHSGLHRLMQEYGVEYLAQGRFEAE